ncbi:hypothetical protein [Hoeflea sp. IMCC20628]|uniref:hypothetical protein n=1 Tax=Hoeflea sp. IMCC20628 TaxID=1620421 RepID=UPI000B325726|nr:hypothetical protein [Hoeflea sp. IMCC20628]
MTEATIVAFADPLDQVIDGMGGQQAFAVTQRMPTRIGPIQSSFFGNKLPTGQPLARGHRATSAQTNSGSTTHLAEDRFYFIDFVLDVTSLLIALIPKPRTQFLGFGF